MFRTAHLQKQISRSSLNPSQSEAKVPCPLDQRAAAVPGSRHRVGGERDPPDCQRLGVLATATGGAKL
jgi:hypothetical protein